MCEIKKSEKEMRVNAFLRKSGMKLEDIQLIFSTESLTPNMKIKVFNQNQHRNISELDTSELTDLKRNIDREIKKRQIISQIDDLTSELNILNSLGEL